MTAENRKIVLGTRGSELARTQARLVEKAIQTVWPEAKIETKIIATQGDKARVIDPRGNVPTRLRKLAENKWDAIVLARAGLGRLGLSRSRTETSFEGRQFFLEVLPCEIFLPAGGQGIIALQVRANDQSAKELVDVANDRETLLCLQAEREFLRRLQGDCNCPVGVLAKIDNGKMKMR